MEVQEIYINMHTISKKQKQKTNAIIKNRLC